MVCPVIASTPGTAAVIPDWDTRRDAGAQMELIRTEDLEDFESTDLSSVSVATRLGVQSRLPSVSIVHQEIACLVTNHQPQPRINRSSSPPRKRRRYMPIAIDKMIPLVLIFIVAKSIMANSNL